MAERNGRRKAREQLSKRRVPELGYYFIVTYTKETEQNYMLGLRDSMTFLLLFLALQIQRGFAEHL